MRSLLAAAAVAALALPTAAEAQLDLLDAGIHGAYATETADGSAGIGGFLALDLPMAPLSIRAAGERFFPDCGADVDGVELEGCAFWGFSLDANLDVLPLPVVSPYLSAGFVYRYLDPSDIVAGEEETGVAVGAGASFELGGLGAFAEARYEFIELPEEQFVVRAGLFF
jgi:opacity protein-like surface antigen